MRLRPTRPIASLILFAVCCSPAGAATRQYPKEPGDIQMDYAFRTLAILCQTSQMPEAEAKAQEVLNKGYRGTRYECWVWEKLARAYDRQGNSSKGIEAYRHVLDSGDPSQGSYTYAKNRIQELGGQVPTGPGTTPPLPSTPPPPRPVAPAPPPPPTAGNAQPTRPADPTTPNAGTKSFAKEPGDIQMEYTFRTLAVLCQTGQMPEAETKAQEVLNKGYRGTRYECWVWGKLAAAYDRLGNREKAIESYQKIVESGSPAQGSYTHAKNRIMELTGSQPK